MQGRLLTLDLAASTGYAIGEPDGMPTFGTISFPPTGDNYGRHQANVRAHLSRLIQFHQPTLIGYEQPSLFGITTPATVRKLCCFGSTLEELCLREGFNVPVKEINPSALKKFWTDKGNAKKPEMVRRARALGFSVTNDDEADAVAAWFFMLDCYGVDSQRERFQQMRFEAGMGVAQKAVF